MLKTILLSLFFMLARNEENQQPISIGDASIKTALSDNSAFIKSEHPIHSRKLLNATLIPTPEPTLEPTFNDDPDGAIGSPNNGSPNSSKKPYYTKQEWDLISGAIGAGSAICCLIICCGGKYVYKSWKGGLIDDIAFELEMGNRKKETQSKL